MSVVVGGIYDVKTYDDYTLQMYYDVSPYDWYNGSYVLTGATDELTGEYNSPLITSVQGAGSYASSVADSLVAGGFDDWYLPSVDELKAIEDSGLVTSGGFWSSTEDNINNAFIYIFTIGKVSLSKAGNFPVLMVRKQFNVFQISSDRMSIQSQLSPIISGGNNSIDEDVYKMIGGVNGISINSKIMSNE